ncbi:MAG: nucleoside deaminase [Pseudonocardiaceae bacterium]
MDQEKEWMDEAIRLAAESVHGGGGPFGALVVGDGKVLAYGTNEVTQTLDPTAHAEILAIRRACGAIDDFRLTGCVLVSSCEPCALCLAAALWARIDRVVYAADRNDAAGVGFDDRAFHKQFFGPRKHWPLEMSQLRTGHERDPFTAWDQSPTKVVY